MVKHGRSSGCAQVKRQAPELYLPDVGHLIAALWRGHEQRTERMIPQQLRAGSFSTCISRVRDALSGRCHVQHLRGMGDSLSERASPSHENDFRRLMIHTCTVHTGARGERTFRKVSSLRTRRLNGVCHKAEMFLLRRRRDSGLHGGVSPRHGAGDCGALRALPMRI